MFLTIEIILKIFSEFSGHGFIAFLLRYVYKVLHVMYIEISMLINFLKLFILFIPTSNVKVLGFSTSLPQLYFALFFNRHPNGISLRVCFVCLSRQVIVNIFSWAYWSSTYLFLRNCLSSAFLIF